jgi:septal ring-binding cell division protein DamX
LAQRLQATSDFIARSSDKTGTIQLITLVMEELNWTPIADYLDQLQREGIDLDNVFVYKRERDRQVVLGILYGEYENSSIARAEIQVLPEKLRENSPFPRSVRGVKKEISGS